MIRNRSFDARIYQAKNRFEAAIRLAKETATINGDKHLLVGLPFEEFSLLREARIPTTDIGTMGVVFFPESEVKTPLAVMYSPKEPMWTNVELLDSFLENNAIEVNRPVSTLIRDLRWHAEQVAKMDFFQTDPDLSAPGLDFSQALLELKEGTALTRNSWPEGTSVIKVDSLNFTHLHAFNTRSVQPAFLRLFPGNEPELWLPMASDLLANDWKVV